MLIALFDMISYLNVAVVRIKYNLVAKSWQTEIAVLEKHLKKFLLRPEKYIPLIRNPIGTAC